MYLNYLERRRETHVNDAHANVYAPMYDRFLADGSEVEGQEKQLWNLPLLYSTASDPKETKLEMMAGETHTLKVCACIHVLFVLYPPCFV